ncbi:MAG: PaaI family thioesterase [Stomatobaculum sp.]|nr:PaaI family thioesterase [Stomatobaculum sp.]MBR7057272.1 PaaI family thioesterase [Stomatobaculum sp.]
MDFAEQMERVNTRNPFLVHNGICITALSSEMAEAEAGLEEFSMNMMGTPHAGLMFLLGECTCGTLLRSDGSKQVLTDSSFRFLRAAGKTDRITAKAVIIKRGRSLSVCRAEIFDPLSGKLLAEGEYQFAAV